MGLKSGSRDSGLDESDEEAEREDEETATGRPTGDADRDATDRTTPEGRSDRSSSRETSSSNQPKAGNIPYKLRRDKVNEGREQVPYFLREEVMDAEGDLQDELESILGEDVYKSDYREASMVVAQRNPELVAEVLREWGYDLDLE